MLCSVITITMQQHNIYETSRKGLDRRRIGLHRSSSESQHIKYHWSMYIQKEAVNFKRIRHVCRNKEQNKINYDELQISRQNKNCENGKCSDNVRMKRERNKRDYYGFPNKGEPVKDPGPSPLYPPIWQPRSPM